MVHKYYFTISKYSFQSVHMRKPTKVIMSLFEQLQVACHPACLSIIIMHHVTLWATAVLLILYELSQLNNAFYRLVPQYPHFFSQIALETTLVT